MDSKIITEMLLAQGLTLAQVALLTDTSISALHRLGLHSRRKPRHTAELKEIAKELKAKGLTSKEIGAILIVPASTIRSWI